MILGAFALLLLALGLVAAEIFLPSHGLLTILAVIAAIVSIVMAFQASAALGLVFTIVIFVATPFVFYAAVRIYPRTPVGKQVMLESARVEAFEDEEAELAALVGQRGMAATTLRPAGMIEVGGRRYDALSDDEVIEMGTGIEVVRVSGLRVFVRVVEGGVG